MRRRQFIRGLAGVVLGGLFKWNFPVFADQAEILVLDEGKPASNTVVWMGNDGEWSDPVNWVGGIVPKNGDNVVITGGACYPTDEEIQLESLTVLAGSVGFRSPEQLDAIEFDGVRRAREIVNV